MSTFVAQLDRELGKRNGENLAFDVSEVSRMGGESSADIPYLQPLFLPTNYREMYYYTVTAEVSGRTFTVVSDNELAFTAALTLLGVPPSLREEAVDRKHADHAQ